ncbi:PaaI family thioesterase [Marivivens sp. JLT3646]|uniref:PaaI family thioesterase n=1 Tax=Marivivens sp. JLT3646 TaxID=1920883 RepID=UPI0007FF8A9C|nr:PaaI family thioesterase [Marivivens sp. JLT3646]APO87688.1 thioesterase [Marivivens sp. JLT3646]OBR36268.1 thioesterase [Donghicola sp. JL3646]
MTVSDDTRARIRDSFAKQSAMALIHAEIPVIEEGRAEIEIPHWDGVLQQHGYVHGGVVGMIADSAAGYAAMTVVPEGTSVLTVEYKINMVAPANGDKIVAKGSVLRAGRTLLLTKADVYAVKDGTETLCAVMQQTIMAMHGKGER